MQMICKRKYVRFTVKHLSDKPSTKKEIGTYSIPSLLSF